MKKSFFKSCLIGAGIVGGLLMSGNIFAGDLLDYVPAQQKFVIGAKPGQIFKTQLVKDMIANNQELKMGLDSAQAEFAKTGFKGNFQEIVSDVVVFGQDKDNMAFIASTEVTEEEIISSMKKDGITPIAVKFGKYNGYRFKDNWCFAKLGDKVYMFSANDKYFDSLGGGKAAVQKSGVDTNASIYFVANGVVNPAAPDAPKMIKGSLNVTDTTLALNVDAAFASKEIAAQLFGQANKMMAVLQMSLAEDQNLALAVKNAVSLKNTDDIVSVGINLNKGLIDQLVAFVRKQAEKQLQMRAVPQGEAQLELIESEDDFDF
ncbi:MAG: hypothetical protein RRY34_03765 [Victivallaceae bacterium]